MREREDLRLKKAEDIGEQQAQEVEKYKECVEDLTQKLHLSHTLREGESQRARDLLQEREKAWGEAVRVRQEGREEREMEEERMLEQIEGMMDILRENVGFVKEGWGEREREKEVGEREKKREREEEKHLHMNDVERLKRVHEEKEEENRIDTEALLEKVRLQGRIVAVDLKTLWGQISQIDEVLESMGVAHAEERRGSVVEKQQQYDLQKQCVEAIEQQVSCVCLCCSVLQRDET